MAKRRRLGPANPVAPAPEPAGLETKGYVNGWAGAGQRRPAPIADMAGAAAAQAALEEVSNTLEQARTEGRLIQPIALASVRDGHLLRDRIALDPEAMAALKASLEARGQQTPIEVVPLDNGDYGLISGLRRVLALRDLGAQTVNALLRSPENAGAAYLAMVEENEIRSDLSFYERARIAAEAAKLGVYADPAAAVSALFASASPSKRSKILNFVTLHEALGDVLVFPAAIPEKVGLALVKAIAGVPAFGPRLRETLRSPPAASAAEERARLDRALSEQAGPPRRPRPAQDGEEVAQGVFLQATRGKVVLSGTGLDKDLVAALRAWLADRDGAPGG